MGARQVHQTLVPALEAADAIVYALVGIVFLLAALGMLGYSLAAFPASLRETGFALAIVTLVNDLLLVMIIMEVLRTVLSYLKERATSLQPFLFIAAISATRRILAIGAQMSVTGDTLSPNKFQEVMVDLGANAGAIQRSPPRCTCSPAARWSSENGVSTVGSGYAAVAF